MYQQYCIALYHNISNMFWLLIKYNNNMNNQNCAKHEKSESYK